MRSFRAERLSAIIAGETPVQIDDPPTLVLHLIPLSAFEPGIAFDLSKFAGQGDPLKPIYSYNWHAARYNFDGLLTNASGIKAADSYVELFRNGIIESVKANWGDHFNNNRVIPLTLTERALLESLPIYLRTQRELGVEPPIFIMFSLFGVAGYKWGVPERFGWHNTHEIDRDALLLPEVVLGDFGQKHYEVLRPPFDILWNAAGFPRSMNYEENGEWRAR
jgi:hypothetical protein